MASQQLKKHQNYKIIVQYDGTRYQGWQRQKTTQNTIQGKLEELLSRLEERESNESIEIFGAGRTDANVHAYAQVFHVRLATEKSESEIKSYMNQYLPEDIAIKEVKKASERFHARLNARGKTYKYAVCFSETPDVFMRRFEFHFPYVLNQAKMEEAASYLLGQHDFRAFTSMRESKIKKGTSAIRTIENIRIQREGDKLQFYYTGNGFLYHMVRILTGTLIEVGEGKREPEDVKRLLQDGKREEAGFLTPGKGLTLIEVFYD